jgi:thiosulfate/3-mercaptopyruvate sulfurtransferase
MTTIFLFVSIMLTLARVGTAGETQRDILVTPEWLAGHLDDPSLVVLQVAEVRSDYLRGHIPGARFLWPGWLENSTPDLSIELLPVARMDSVLESLGIFTESRVVLCHTYTFASAASAARAWVTLDYLGMGDRAKILDGGFEAWRAAGKPISKESPTFAQGTFTPAIKEDVFVDLEYVKANMAKPGVRLVDSRRPDDFTGDAAGILPGGHIPGAVSLPYSSVIEESLRYAPLDTIAARFAAAGIGPEDDIISYCYKGKAACLIHVAARMMGHTVHVYDGSFEEWWGHEDLPVEAARE